MIVLIARWDPGAHPVLGGKGLISGRHGWNLLRGRWTTFHSRLGSRAAMQSQSAREAVLQQPGKVVFAMLRTSRQSRVRLPSSLANVELNEVGSCVEPSGRSQVLHCRETLTDQGFALVDYGPAWSFVTGGRRGRGPRCSDIPRHPNEAGNDVESKYSLNQAI